MRITILASVLLVLAAFAILSTLGGNKTSECHNKIYGNTDYLIASLRSLPALPINRQELKERFERSGYRIVNRGGDALLANKGRIKYCSDFPKSEIDTSISIYGIKNENFFEAYYAIINENDEVIYIESDFSFRNPY